MTSNDASTDDDVDTSYLHHPFLNPADFVAARELLRLPPRGHPRTTTRTRIWRPPTPAPELARLFRWGLTPHAGVIAAEWEEAGFLDTERDVWIDCGLNLHEADLARQCRDQGLPPAALRLDLYGRTVIEHLRAGRRVRDVLSQLRAQAS